MSDLMSPAEHKVLELLAEVHNLMCAVIGDGPTRQADLRESVADIHRMQDRVLAQAAARAYPDRYRLLGGLVGDPDRMISCP